MVQYTSDIMRAERNIIKAKYWLQLSMHLCLKILVAIVHALMLTYRTSTYADVSEVRDFKYFHQLRSSHLQCCLIHSPDICLSYASPPQVMRDLSLVQLSAYIQLKPQCCNKQLSNKKGTDGISLFQN